jgi:hypothetical protein
MRIVTNHIILLLVQTNPSTCLSVRGISHRNSYLDAAQSLLNQRNNHAIVAGGEELSLLQKEWQSCPDVDCRRRVPVEDIACFQDIAETIVPHGKYNEDVSKALESLVQGFVEVSGVEEVVLRVVHKDQYEAACPNFHVDKVRVRALLTLLGPGTEYLVDGNEKVLQTKPLEVLFLKGTRWHENDPFGIQPIPLFSWISPRSMSAAASESLSCRHRSPVGPTQRRVFVSVDECMGQNEPEWLIGRENLAAT